MAPLVIWITHMHGIKLRALFLTVNKAESNTGGTWGGKMRKMSKRCKKQMTLRH